jgi:hypothetical protein
MRQRPEGQAFGSEGRSIDLLINERAKTVQLATPAAGVAGWKVDGLWTAVSNWWTPPTLRLGPGRVSRPNVSGSSVRGVGAPLLSAQLFGEVELTHATARVHGRGETVALIGVDRR